MTFFNANRASKRSVVNFNSSLYQSTKSTIYGQIEAFKSGESGGLAFGMRNQPLRTFLNFKGDGTFLEFGK